MPSTFHIIIIIINVHLEAIHRESTVEFTIQRKDVSDA